MDGPAPLMTGFSRADVCQIIGLTPPRLEILERVAGRGARAVASFALSDLLALAVLRELSDRLGDRLDAYAAGLGQLFELLAARPDAGHLDGEVAVVGRDFTRLYEIRSHVHCVGDDFVAVPLRPLLAELRDQVFS